jgi:predicted choloylglycine hydrolase
VTGRAQKGWDRVSTVRLHALTANPRGRNGIRQAGNVLVRKTLVRAREHIGKQLRPKGVQKHTVVGALRGPQILRELTELILIRKQESAGAASSKGRRTQLAELVR